MGIDIIAWKNCPLQEKLGPDEFLAKIKLVSYKRAAEETAPGRLENHKVRIRTTGQPDRILTYPALCTEIQEIVDAVPECAACFLSSGREFGSYHYISYPLDATFERLVFAYFVEQIPVENSICNQIYRDIISVLPREGLPWHTFRGDAVPRLAELPAPLRQSFDSPQGDYFDSAQILEALFCSISDTAQLVAFGVFWGEFARYADARVSRASSRTLVEALHLEHFFQQAVASALSRGCEILMYV